MTAPSVASSGLIQDLGGDVLPAAGRVIPEVALVDLVAGGRDIVGPGRAFGPSLGQELGDQALQFRRCVGAQAAQRGRLFVEVLVDQVPGGTAEGPLSGDHLVQDAAERVKVEAVVESTGERAGFAPGKQTPSKDSARLNSYVRELHATTL